MNERLWYPQLDVYDGIRRIGLLLIRWNPVSPTLEHLYIADFYVANPPLLHQTSMTHSVRKTFKKLDIAKPGTTFLRYPTPQLLFHKMRPIQKSAIHSMVGKSIVDVNSMQLSKARLTTKGIKLFQIVASENSSEYENSLINFLVAEFTSLNTDNPHELRRRTKLRRIS